MAEMGITVSTADLGPAAISICESFHSARKIIIKRWPAAASIKFRLGIVERCVAATAEVSAGSKMHIVLTRKRGFRPPERDHARLIGIENIP